MGNVPIVQKTTSRDTSRLYRYDGRKKESPLTDGVNNTMNNNTDGNRNTDSNQYIRGLYTIMKSKASITMISEKERTSKLDGE
ncbi:7584_t:CDS:2, partial [Gigaspora rosea]